MIFVVYTTSLVLGPLDSDSYMPHRAMALTCK